MATIELQNPELISGPVAYTPGPILMVMAKDSPDNAEASYAAILMSIPHAMPLGYRFRSRSEVDEFINGLKVIRDKCFPSEAIVSN